MRDVEPYGVGPVSMSVCHVKTLPLDDVIDEVNRLEPTGISSRWGPSTEETFATGQPNPCPCERDPGRVHRLFHC